MNLSKLVLDKIKELKPTKAAAYFGVSVPTIYSWQKKKNPPVEAAQKVLDEMPETSAPEPEGEMPQPEAEVDPKVIEEQSAPSNDLVELTRRVERLEGILMGATDPMKKVPLTSGVHPFKNPESGIATVSKAEVIEGQGDRRPEAPLWNQPVNPAPKQQGWNAPISKVEGGRNPAGDWNKPVPRE